MAHPIPKSGIDSPLSHGGTNPGLSYLAGLAKWSGRGSFSPDTIREVLNHLGNPQDKIPSVHVGGTNGKGSVSAILASILGSAGYGVGLSTSPHLSRCNERVVLDGIPISDEKLSFFALILKEIEEKRGLTLSFHEAFTAIGFMAFHENELDWMVIEVGLGGRLDSTNVIKSPKAIAITSIGFDHEEQLGSTLESIAREKCGIFREGVPVIYGDLREEALGLVESEAAKLKCRTFGFGKEFKCGAGVKEQLRYEDEIGIFKLSPALKGRYQIENIGVSCKIARVLGISEGSIQKGVSQVKWPARFESITYKGKHFIIDSAHNADGARALANSLKTNNINKLNLIFSSLYTKNWKDFLSHLLPLVSRIYFLKANSPSSIEFGEVEDFLSCFDIKPINFGMEYNRLICEVGNDLPLLATGSMYMVGGLRELLVKGSSPIWIRGSENE